MSGNPFDILKTLDRDQLKQNKLKEYENHPKYEIIKKAKNWTYVNILDTNSLIFYPMERYHLSWLYMFWQAG